MRANGVGASSWPIRPQWSLYRWKITPLAGTLSVTRRYKTYPVKPRKSEEFILSEQFGLGELSEKLGGGNTLYLLFGSAQPRVRAAVAVFPTHNVLNTGTRGSRLKMSR